MTTAIDRAFVRTSAGLIHYRSAGSDELLPPVVLLHGGPGSSSSLVGMMQALAATRRVIAPDTAGCGSSDPIPEGEPSIGTFADILAETLDRLGVTHVDLYGHHTGAQIACELAIAQPNRVRRMVLDGAALFPAELRDEFLELYAPPIVPAANGDHLMWVWDFANRLTRYFPHYRTDDAHRSASGVVLSPEIATTIAAGILQVWPTWHLAYRAAFAHDLAARLPLAAAPALVLRSAGDPLADYAVQAAALLPEGTVADVTPADKADAVREFLSSG